MAEASTTYLLSKIDYFVSKEFKLRGSIEEGIKELKRQHEMITEVIKGADSYREQGNPIRVWIQHLRSIDYEIVNVLNMCAYKNASGNAVPWYQRWQTMTSHSIAKKIQEIETNLNRTKRNKEDYQIGLSSHPASTSTEHEAGLAPLYSSEMEIVGVERPREELASWVLDVEQAFRVMFVVGMGGSGKTALVNLVYEQLKTDFDCHAWLTASMFEQTKELLSAMYSKLCNQTGQSSSTSSHDLIDMLINYLQDKRYLIVLDNWNRKDWESVKCAFPKVNISRVIVTTRRGDIASLCRDTSADICNIPPLPFENAQQLFCCRAFPESGTFPSVPGLPEISDRLLKKCEGLPIGIIEMGKHLSHTEKTVSVFKKIESSLPDELKLKLSSIVLSGYNDLPYHLKCCFLYMSMFPEDYPVNCRMLIRLWMAEDFIQKVNQNEPEDIGEGYLEELMERNLVKASEFEFDGRPRTCRLHSLVHKIVLAKSKDDKFCTDTGGDISEQMQRLSIQNSEFSMPDKVHHVHTFFSLSLHMKILPGIIPSMKLLKILHLDHAMLEALPKGIKKLLLLKYLSLRNTRIKLLPISTGRLKFLETLNLKQTLVTELPDSLVALENLCHLLGGLYRSNGLEAFDAVQGMKVPKRISKLTNLQTLSFVRADIELLQGLGNLRKLRKLGIVDLPSDSGPLLCKAIQELTSLRSLSMTSQNMNEVLKIQEINNPPELQHLNLRGRLERMPQWISQLHELVRIRLKWSRLAAANSPIPILGKLNNLLELQLLDAYTGIQLTISAGTFLKLKTLELHQMKELQKIVIANGAFPCLQKLKISLCQNLREIPTRFTNMTEL